jgi:energy-coupling factor transporter ATP-binding protein EcfA2
MAKTTKKAPAAKATPKVEATPFYLSKARLKGYKTLKDCSVDFKPGLNIIIGKNGAGKTNFLTLLNKAINNDLKNEYFSEIEFNISGINEFNVKVNRKAKKIDGTWKIDGTHLIGNDLNIEIHKDGKKIEFDGFDPFANYNPQFIVHSIPDNYLFFTKPLSYTFYFDQPTSASELNKEIDGQQSYFTKSIISKLLQWNKDHYKHKDDRFGDNSLLLAELKSELYHLNFIVSEYSDVKQFRFKETFGFSYSKTKNSTYVSDLQLEFLVGEDWLSFDQLSDGTKRIVYIITEIGFHSPFFFNGAIRGRGSSVGFKSRIILLEEPELSIHPHLLSNLMDFIREQSKHKQIIITTHSPQVLDMLYKNEFDRIIIASYEPDKGTQMRHLTKAEQQKAIKYLETTGFFSDYWRLSDLEKE